MKFVPFALCLIAVTTANRMGRGRYLFRPKSNENAEMGTDSKHPHSKAPQGRIANGQQAEPKQFPYQAGLLLYNNHGIFWCAGSLISNLWIVTAAHCMAALFSVDVCLGGVWRMDRKDRNEMIISVYPNAVIIHEQYNATDLLNDIALIKLPEAIQFTDYIKPIQLPKRMDNKKYPTYLKRTAATSGWGLQGANETNNAHILRWVQVPIVDNGICSYYTVTTAEMICVTTKGGVSPCFSDSGGPLVADENGTPTLIGITSKGSVLNCEVEWPVVYTRVSSYVDWIAKKSGVVNK